MTRWHVVIRADLLPTLLTVSTPISLDEPASWPQELRELASEATQYEACQGDYTVDLRPPLHLSNRIQTVLVDHGITVYQCARLLDSEVADIQRNGLRPASKYLLSDKLEAARAEGLITEDEAELLLTTGVLNDREQREVRIDKICALTILRTLTIDPDGTQPLLTNWGGEITYFWQTQSLPELAERLQRAGNPALIEFQHQPRASDLCAPELAKVVIGRYRDLDDCAGEIQISVPPGDRIPVLDIWQRDDARWPRNQSTEEW